MNENENSRIKLPTDKLAEAFSSPLYLTLAVLMSIVTGASLLGGGGIEIFYLLSTIGAWLVYAAAKNNGISSEGLAIISGTSKAVRIVSLVLAILVLVIAVFSTVGISAIISEIPEKMSAEAFMKVIDKEMANGSLELDTQTYGLIRDALYEIGRATEGMDISAFISIFLIIITVVMYAAGAVLLVFSLTFYKTLHKFNKSLCERARMGAEVKKASSLRVWLMVLGIISGIGAISGPNLFNMFALASSLSGAATYIIGSIWIGKYFLEESVNSEPSPGNADGE